MSRRALICVLFLWASPFCFGLKVAGDPLELGTMIVEAQGDEERAAVAAYAEGLPGQVGTERLIGNIGFDFGDAGTLYLFDISGERMEELFAKFRLPEGRCLTLFEELNREGVKIPSVPLVTNEGLDQLEEIFRTQRFRYILTTFADFHRIAAKVPREVWQKLDLDKRERIAFRLLRFTGLLDGMLKTWRQGIEDRALQILSRAGHGPNSDFALRAFQSMWSQPSALQHQQFYVGLGYGITQLLDLLDTPSTRKILPRLADVMVNSPKHYMLAPQNQSRFIDLWYELANAHLEEQLQSPFFMIVPRKLVHSSKPYSLFANGGLADGAIPLPQLHDGVPLPVSRLLLDGPEANGSDRLAAFLLTWEERLAQRRIGHGHTGEALLARILYELARARQYAAMPGNFLGNYIDSSQAILETMLANATTEGMRIAVIDEMLTLIDDGAKYGWTRDPTILASFRRMAEAIRRDPITGPDAYDFNCAPLIAVER